MRKAIAIKVGPETAVTSSYAILHRSCLVTGGMDMDGPQLSVVRLSSTISPSNRMISVLGGGPTTHQGRVAAHGHSLAILLGHGYDLSGQP